MFCWFPVVLLFPLLAIGGFLFLLKKRRKRAPELKGSQLFVPSPPKPLYRQFSSTGISDAKSSLTPALTFVTNNGIVEAAEPTQVEKFLKRSRMPPVKPTWRRLEKDETLCEEGQAAENVYVVAYGELRSSTTMGVGESLGHASFHRHTVATAETVVAVVNKAQMSGKALLKYCRSELAQRLRIASFSLETWLGIDASLVSSLSKCPPTTFNRTVDGLLYEKGVEAKAFAVDSRGRVYGGLEFACGEEYSEDVYFDAPTHLREITEEDFVEDSQVCREALKAAVGRAKPILDCWCRLGLVRRFASAGSRLPEGAHLVLSGRVVADGVMVARGQVVGVSELVTKRKQDAFASRDSDLVCLPSLECLPPVCAAAVMRKQLEQRDVEPENTVACVLSSSPESNELAKALGASLASEKNGLEGACGEKNKVLLVEDFQGEREDFANWLSSAERAHRRVVLVAFQDQEDWAGIAVNSADVVLLVTNSASSIETRLLRSRQRKILVVCRPHSREGAQTPILDERRSGVVDLSLNVRVSEDGHIFVGDARRVARFAVGRATGLVLGGGGARGLAHIGALRALSSAGIEVDCIGGCSQGAMVAHLAAAYGIERVEECLAKFARVLSDPFSIARDYARGIGSPFTFSGKGLAEAVAATFPSQYEVLEQALLPTFSVSTDITDSTTRIHRSGSVAFATLASMSVAGLFPPVKDPSDGHLLVDGGYAANLPVAEMRRFVGPRGRVVAVDVEAKKIDFSEFFGDWRLGYVSKKKIDVFSELLYIRNYQQLRQDADKFDLCVRLESVQKFGFSEYSKIKEIASSAERETLAVLKQYLQSTQHPSTSSYSSPNSALHRDYATYHAPPQSSSW